MIGVIHCECHLTAVKSLKEKRAILKSALTRIRQRTNVSISEMADQDIWQRASISFACISSSRSVVEKELQRALKLIDSTEGLECHSLEYEWL